MQQYRVYYRVMGKEGTTFHDHLVGVFNAQNGADACYQASLTDVPDDEPYTPQMTVRESVRLSLVAYPVRSSGLEEMK